MRVAGSDNNISTFQHFSLVVMVGVNKIYDMQVVSSLLSIKESLHLVSARYLGLLHIL